jgi:hypothetical protein
MRYAAKRDQSEHGILQALAKVGADYILLDAFDVLVLYRGSVHLLECKTPKKGRKTVSQKELVSRGWPLHFVQTPEQALQAIGAMK